MTPFHATPPAPKKKNSSTPTWRRTAQQRVPNWTPKSTSCAIQQTHGNKIRWRGIKQAEINGEGSKGRDGGRRSKEAGAYASAKAEDPKSVCFRAGFDWEEGEQDCVRREVRGSGAAAAEWEEADPSRPGQAGGCRKGSGNRGASGAERNWGEKRENGTGGRGCRAGDVSSHVGLRIGPVECRG